MYKIIISSLCVLLGFAACRSGKGVTPLAKKDALTIKKDRVLDSISEKKEKDSIIQLLNQSLPVNNQNYQKLSDSVLKQLLQTEGFAYEGGVKYLRIKEIPEKILKYFPEIVVFSYQGVGFNQPGIRQDIGAIINNNRLYLPRGFNKMLPYSITSISLKEQIEIILTLRQYPFPICNITSIVEEKWTSEVNMIFNYKATGQYNNQNYEFKLNVQENKIREIDVFNKEIFNFSITLYED